MKILSVILFCFISTLSFAGGDSVEVLFESITEIKPSVYELKYQEIQSKKQVILKLEYNSIQYHLLPILNKEKFEKAIELLKTQVATRQPERFGSFGGGPCKVFGSSRNYRSDALDIHVEVVNGIEKHVVYAFCEHE